LSDESGELLSLQTFPLPTPKPLQPNPLFHVSSSKSVSLGQECLVMQGYLLAVFFRGGLQSREIEKSPCFGRSLQHELPWLQARAQKHQRCSTCLAAERIRILGIAQKLAEEVSSSFLLHVT